MIEIRCADNLELMAEIESNTIDLIYCEPIGELCVYVDNVWHGYLDENLPLTDGHSWFVISNGKYIGIDEPSI